jgi:hypothetical protein
MMGFISLGRVTLVSVQSQYDFTETPFTGANITHELKNLKELINSL